jgi:hypothetical protein
MSQARQAMLGVMLFAVAVCCAGIFFAWLSIHLNEDRIQNHETPVHKSLPDDRWAEKDQRQV